MSYKELAKIILRDIGGRENIKMLTHCDTRLRFELNDIKRADTLHLRNVRGIHGVIVTDGQYMIVIGKGVESVYSEIRKIMGAHEAESHDVYRTDEKRRKADYFVYFFVIAGFLYALSEIAEVWGGFYINPNIKRTLAAIAGCSLYSVPLIVLRRSGKKRKEEIFFEKETIYAPVKGRVVALAEVSDPLMAEGLCGEGAAIVPETDLVISPVRGRVTGVTAAGNAVTVKAETGAEVLVHLGIDDRAERRFFKAFVSEGDKVRVGDPLVEVEKNAIEAEGYVLTAAVIITNPERYRLVRTVTDMASEQKPLLEAWISQ